ncbi:zinc finger protein 311 [Drosophila nasuta]|uniref:zinc finger protein 311 n=1 Tax=Drosophila nasuta TaxID=42062 RepID=UPI00295F2F78|nr:zinc finger protein 311 [Drosophila nasuta]
MSTTLSHQDIMNDDEPDPRNCRTCNVLTTRYLSLYEPYTHAGELTTLAALLSNCANLEILQSERFLPRHMCEQCVELLLQFCDFQRMVLRTDFKLRKRHAHTQRKVNAPQLSKCLTEQQIEEDAAATADEYVYVLEETVDSIVSEQRLDGSSPKVELFEVDFEPEEKYVEEQHEQEEEETSIATVKTEESNVKQRSQHRRKSYNPALQCPMCSKQLSTSNSFKYHMQLHGEDRPYVCNICGDSFKTRNAYDGHATLHNPNNPNKCRTCGKTYRQASSLRSHLLSHTGVKPFTCDICGKGLTQKSGYKKHMLTHTGEKPHTCDSCGRSFRYSSNLIAHKRSHSRKVGAVDQQKEQLE